MTAFIESRYGGTRRARTWVTVMLAAMFVAAGCTQGAGTDTPSASAVAPSTAPSAAASGPTAPPEGELEDELVILTSGGAFEEAFIEHFYEPFEAETGVDVIPVAAPFGDQWAKIRADAQGGNIEWDIVDTGPDPQEEYNQYLMDFGDCTILPEVMDRGVEGACAQYRVLRTLGGGVLAYDTTKFSEAPESWADFWDTERFPGPRALSRNEFLYTMMSALYADGVTAEQMFPLDVDRALAKLDEIRPEVVAFWESGDQSQQLWRNGEVVMSMLYSGRAVGLQKEGVPVGITWKGAAKDQGGWGILKDAPHPNAAVAFLDYFYTRPEAHLAFADQINYDTGSAAALEAVPEADRPLRATYPDNWDNMLTQDEVWVAENRDAVLERWTAWLAQ
jgi:mannopine transport system substrate-binding protein